MKKIIIIKDKNVIFKSNFNLIKIVKLNAPGKQTNNNLHILKH